MGVIRNFSTADFSPGERRSAYQSKREAIERDPLDVVQNGPLGPHVLRANPATHRRNPNAGMRRDPEHAGRGSAIAGWLVIAMLLGLLALTFMT